MVTVIAVIVCGSSQGKRMTFAVNIVNDEVIIITTSIIVKNYQ